VCRSACHISADTTFETSFFWAACEVAMATCEYVSAGLVVRGLVKLRYVRNDLITMNSAGHSVTSSTWKAPLCPQEIPILAVLALGLTLSCHFNADATRKVKLDG
jgi:hypothetical protein